MHLRLQTAIILSLILSLPTIPSLAAADEPRLTSQRDQFNYALGVNIINTFKQQGADIDLDMVTRGMKDAASGGKLLLTEEELRQTLADYQRLMMQRRVTATSKQAEANKREGEAFLRANAKKEGVVTLPSGLQYTVIQQGKGASPQESSMVECQYRGTYINGNEFDNSSRAGHSAIVKVSDMIPGWRQALPLMPAGSKWKLFVPPTLAYGERGKGGMIGPNTVLIFDLELIAIK